MKKFSILLIGMSLAMACEAKVKKFKNPEPHEKTISITDHADTVFLQSETIAINTENYRSYEYQISGEGFGIIQRYNNSCACGQFNYSSNGIDRHEWRYLITRNYNSNATLSKLSINQKRSSIGKVFVQRTGVENTGKGTADTKALYRKLKKAGYTIYNQNDRSSIYPKVDSLFCMVRSSVLFIDNPLYRFSLN